MGIVMHILILIMYTAVCLDKGVRTQTQVVREICRTPLLLLSDTEIIAKSRIFQGGSWTQSLRMHDIIIYEIP
jgi:hypothetical protein